MYAVVETGGKQYKVAEGDLLKVELLEGEPGQEIVLNQVLMLNAGDEKILVGNPLVAGASVAATIVEHGKHKKILVIKFKKRKDYRRKKGHRQCYTQIQIGKINAPGVNMSK